MKQFYQNPILQMTKIQVIFINNFLKKNTNIKKVLFLFLIVISTSQLSAQNCNCSEYVYLNEISNGGRIHKYNINETNGSLTEILENGSSWYPGTGLSELANPHGLTTDLNGFLYVGENYWTGEIRKITCDGTLFSETDFLITDEARFTNMHSIGNTLFTNNNNAYDICSGQLLGSVSLCGDDGGETWGFYYDENTGYFYSTGSNTELLWRYTESDYNSGVCVSSFIDENDFAPVYDLSAGNLVLRGITTDNAGNIYVMVWGPGSHAVVKFDANGNYITHISDTVDGDGGFFSGIGIVYSETADVLYLSTISLTEDCISIIDTDLTTVTAGVGPTGNSGQGQTGFDQAKAISINSECCPNPTNLIIDTLFCDMSFPTDFFLQDLLDCEGVICEGSWTPDPNNTGISFNDCNNSVSISGDQACGTFNLFSDGSSALSQCGQFSITVNIETATTPIVSVTDDQTFCPGDALMDLVATSSSAIATFQWQMSTSSCNGPWSDIVGANSAIYTPASDLSQTTYFQVIATEMGGCATGSCETTSECITIMLSDQCYDVALTKSIDTPTASIGEDITFTIVVENLGPAITGATVNDVLPTGLVYNNVYTTTTGTYDGTNWIIGTMAANQIDSIQITAIVDAEGAIINEAIVTINESETDLTNNEDNACVSIPIQVCDNEAINVDIIAASGFSMYQWYKDGILIAGATTDIYTAIETGTYTYTVDGAGPTGDCQGELCCPIIIEQISCCPPKICLPITVTKLN